MGLLEQAVKKAEDVVEERLKLFFQLAADACSEPGPYLNDEAIRTLVRGECGVVAMVVKEIQYAAELYATKGS